MDLRNGEVMVDVESNQRTMGPSGRRTREATSCYLLVGGSSNAYKVTITSKRGGGGHFCVEHHTGNPCKGNTFGKKRVYGPCNVRDTQDPEQWCKHVAAALRRPDLIAEAQEITAQAFGQAPKVEPKSAPVTPAPVVSKAVLADAQARLAALDAERAELQAAIDAEKAGKLREAIAALVAEHGFDTVQAAVANAA